MPAKPKAKPRSAKRFEQRRGRHRTGLATGGDAMKARVKKKPEVDRPTLASQGGTVMGRQVSGFPL